MAKKPPSDAGARVPAVVQQLVEVAALDTVYGDVYLDRARDLLGSLLPLAQYRALKDVQRSIDEAVKQSKAAAVAQDWSRVETLTAQVESLRQSAEEKAALIALGTTVYDTAAVKIDPFSPGLDFLAKHEQDPATVRDGLVNQLKALARADAPSAAFYESRRGFFAGLELLAKRAVAMKVSGTDRTELERLAAQAAQQGDMGQLRRYAQELVARQTKEKTPEAPQTPAPSAPVDRAAYRCPVDLAAQFPEEVAGQAKALGMAVVRTEPLAQAAPLFEYVTTHAWQPAVPSSETEREGAMRTETIVDQVGFPKDVSEAIKVLVGQFLRNPFVNSGGARYLPLFSAEAVLIEDFAEDQEPPKTGELLTALGLPRRRGLARQAIDGAVREHGASILARLRLDPLDFRLVCIPQDLYMRVGRERGWGQQQLWTHFDGYQVLKNGTLRALVGGDVRHGGLSDLVSIAINDERDAVVARFAVVRRARQVARWR